MNFPTLTHLQYAALKRLHNWCRGKELQAQLGLSHPSFYQFMARLKKLKLVSKDDVLEGCHWEKWYLRTDAANRLIRESQEFYGQVARKSRTPH